MVEGYLFQKTTLFFKPLVRIQIPYFSEPWREIRTDRMRLLLSTLLGLFSFVASGQVVTWVTPTHHDFGEIKYMKPEVVHFVFRNETSRPIVIDNVRTTCGCTAPDWDDSPIQPMATDTISIEYDARRTGYFEKKIKVFFDGVKKPELLSIEGEVVE